MLLIKQIKEKDLAYFYKELKKIMKEKPNMELMRFCVKMNGGIFAKENAKIIFFTFFHIAKNKKGEEFFSLLHFWLHPKYRHKLYLKYFIELNCLYKEDKDVLIRSDNEKLIFQIKKILEPINSQDYKILTPYFVDMKSKILREIYQREE